MTTKLNINSKSCTTFTTDVQSGRRLQRHFYATALLHCWWHAGLGVPTRPQCAAATPPQSESSPCSLDAGARPIQYSPWDLDPDCWAASATKVWHLASRVSAALGLPSLVRGELVPHPAERYNKKASIRWQDSARQPISVGAGLIGDLGL